MRGTFEDATGRSGARAENVTSQGINIVLAIDLSSSMLAQDFQPQNRIEVAKDVVKKFIAARSSDRIGIVAFAAEALTQVPLTTDYPVVSSAVDNLAPGQLEDGTAIGTALATAANGSCLHGCTSSAITVPAANERITSPIPTGVE